jgi:hypothetical protein
VQAGAGIVADSVPASEWQETQNEARAVLRAAEMGPSVAQTAFAPAEPLPGSLLSREWTHTP